MADANDLATLMDISSVRTTYRPNHGKTVDIVEKAYVQARDFLLREHPAAQSFQSILTQHASLEDVLAVLDDAKHEYEVCTAGRGVIHQWLGKVSERLLYYGNVLDVLSQHHPEYIALVWGTMKFILRGLMNHQELLAKFSQAIVEIGDALSMTKLRGQLYQTDLMKNAIGRLYSYILLFFQGALQWYTAHPLKRAMRSIAKPYDLEYKQIAEQIKSCAQSVSDIAGLANQAEVRDMHLAVQRLQGVMRNQAQKLADLQAEIQFSHKRIDVSIDQILQVALANKSLTERVVGDVSEMAGGIKDIQLSQILQFLGTKAPADELLMRVRSIAKRYHASSGTSSVTSDVLRTFEQWTAVSGQALFVLRTHARAELRAKDVAVLAIQHLKKHPIPVLWTISPLAHSSLKPTVSTIIQGLLYQAIRQDQSLLKADLGEISAAKFQDDRTESEWIDLLCVLLERMARCFIVVETQHLFELHKDDPAWVTSYFDLFQRIMQNTQGASVKILVLSYYNCKPAIHCETSKYFSAGVQQARLVPLRLGTPIIRQGRRVMKARR